MKKYKHREIEKKIQKKWNKSEIFKTDFENQDKPKYYLLDMFPYPSGAGMHMGHVENYTITDTYYRYKRMKGFNVLHPQGIDAFGLPAENYAIKTGIHPKETTEKNIANYKKQWSGIGTVFDFLDEGVTTSNPEYYKWTQWIFGKFFENDLVYKKTTKANWCSSCNTIIANEQIENGKCERCKTQIIQKNIPSWMFRTTDFAEELIEGLDEVDWPEYTKKNQRAWIGKSSGAEIDFDLVESEYVDINRDGGKDSYRDGVEEIERYNVVVIIEHPEKDQFLCAKWKKVDWQGFVTGGIEDGDSVEETALKEVREETGYQNPEIVKVYNKSSHGKFYHVGKKVNRFAHYRIVQVKLKDLEKKERSEEEKAIADMIWVPKNEVNDFLKRGDMKYPWRVVNGEDMNSDKIKVFTTRPDTLFGATYMVLAPEHNLVQKLKGKITNWDEVEKYIFDTKKKTELERLEGKEKTGVELEGVKAVNSARQKAGMDGVEIPIFISDYVLAGYGTGAIMAVPAHDERDFEFAKKFGIEIREVVTKTHNRVVGNDEKIIAFIRENIDSDKKIFIKYGSEELVSKSLKNELDKNFDIVGNENDADYFFLIIGTDKIQGTISERYEYKIDIKKIYTEKGALINSGPFDGMESEEAKKKITEFVGGKMTSTYRLRDWSISRQRYWGTPIPIVYDPEGKARYVGDENLPWLLPTDVDFVPTGEAPLAKSKELLKRTEKIFGEGWTPEVDTMDTFVDSSWYFLRYPDPNNDKEFASEERLKKWMPVDLYIGGDEHTYMHLLYARFFTRAMYKMGLIDFKEPFLKLKHQGMVCDGNRKKMSKSKGNVVNPDEMVERFGADATRAYMLFTGPIEDDVIWNEDNIVGIYRWIEKIWRQQEKLTNENLFADRQRGNLDFKKVLHKTIKSVSKNIEDLRFNVAISDMMKLMNFADKQEKINRDDYLEFIKLVSPFIPHTAEEIFTNLRGKKFVIENNWPEYDEELAKDDLIILAVQVNGKKRGEIEIIPEAEENEVVEKSKANEEIARWLEGDIKKIIYVKGRILNFVIL